MDIVNLINTLGFPIACVIFLAVNANKNSKQAREDGNTREKFLIADGKEREKTLMDANKEFALALNKASDAITKNGELSVALFERMHTVECKIDTVTLKVDSLNIVLSKAVEE